MAEIRKARRATDDEALVNERESSDHDEEILEGDEPEVLDEAEPEPSGEDEPDAPHEDEPSANGRRRSSRRRPARPNRSAPTANRDKSALTASEAAKTALRQIVELTGKRAEGITSVQRTEDGWSIGVEVVEDRRIPSSADILATYEAAIEADGELMSYRRVRRYTRGRGDGSEER
jgi:hypothetical protein